MLAAVAGFDEFSLLRENAEEAGLPWRGPPRVERRAVAVDGERRVSALVWGEGEPELALLHGGAQNAHTWDTVALALGRPLVALDLPGHGRSDWRPQHDYGPPELAQDVAVALRALAPRVRGVVGMSLGGLTSIALASRHPELVPRLAVVDVTPGADRAKAEPVLAFISGPESFESFEAILERTVRFNPTRSLASLRRGVLHNAVEGPDGRWTWRYDALRRFAPPGAEGASARRAEVPDFRPLWEDVSALEAPLLLVCGGESGAVGPEDVAELRRRQPQARVEVVAGSGHSVQGDRPLELAALLRDFFAA